MRNLNLKNEFRSKITIEFTYILKKRKKRIYFLPRFKKQNTRRIHY